MRRIERGRQKKKKDYRWYNGSWRTGINRYIMECKFHLHLPSLLWFPELIDTLWNVNKVWRLTHINCIDELIDTLWNVNDYEVFNLTKKEQELIDTLWNVNIFSRPCRFWNHRELIDTLWNVNELLAVVVYVIIGINRYIMECK